MSTLDPTARSIVPPKPPRRRGIQRFFAWTFAIVGAFFMLIALVPLDPENDEGRIVVMIFGAMLLAVGGGWVYVTRRGDGEQRSRYDEKAILAVAARHGGRATIAQITLETDLSMQQAEETLNRLCGRNIAQPDLLDDGSVVYLFGILGGRTE